MRKYFAQVVSYKRFVELMGYSSIALFLYAALGRRGKVSGISFIDSTRLTVCDNHRIKQHQVFSTVAKRGKSSMGWFYGFKLHLIINERGEICSFCLTGGNVDDRNAQVIDHLCKGIWGKLFGDRGYIGKAFFERLYKQGIQVITKLKKGMKKSLMPMKDKLLLRKRAVIESVNDFLKNICVIQHTRHRSIQNFLVNLAAAIAAYSFLPYKPSIHLQLQSSLPSSS
jgi:hypothetical protein